MAKRPTLQDRMKAATTPTVEVIPVEEAENTISQEMVKATGTFHTLEADVTGLEVVDAESYLAADTLLGKVQGARKGWASIWNRIQERTINPIRQGLESLYETNRAVDRPLEQLEKAIKGKQSSYKMLEARRIAEAEQAKQLEADRLKREAEEAERKAQAAKSAPLRKKLEAEALQKAQAAEEVKNEPSAEPVRAANSTVRTTPTPTITRLLQAHDAVSKGIIPSDVFIINEKRLKEYYKEYPDDVREWPGVEIINEVTIVGR